MMVAFSGCVSHKKYNLLQADYNASQVALAESRTKVSSLETLLEQARNDNKELKDNYAALQRTLDQSIMTNQSGNVNISKLVDEINASNNYIKRLVEAKSKSDSLLMVLSNNLTRSLDTSELKDVDVKVLKGVVYISLADNMLFKSGSYDISPKAMDILDKIAKIIKDYKNYSVLVEGQHRQCAYQPYQHTKQLGFVGSASFISCSGVAEQIWGRPAASDRRWSW